VPAGSGHPRPPLPPFPQVYWAAGGPEDEPTGHQDAVSERRVLQSFGRAASEGASCLIATHDVALAPRLDRVIEMADGRLTGTGAPRSQPMATQP